MELSLCFFHIRSNNNEALLRYKDLCENFSKFNRNGSCIEHAAFKVTSVYRILVVPNSCERNELI